MIYPIEGLGLIKAECYARKLSLFAVVEDVPYKMKIVKDASASNATSLAWAYYTLGNRL